MRTLSAAFALILLAGPALAGTKSVVFFTTWSAGLDAPALAVVAGAARAALAQPAAKVTVTGSTDPDGSAAANDLLSRLRAQVVKDALVADGVPAARIATRGVGIVPYSGSKLESRRTIIAVGD